MTQSSFVASSLLLTSLSMVCETMSSTTARCIMLSRLKFFAALMPYSLDVAALVVCLDDLVGGVLDALRAGDAPLLAPCEVPLALIHWTLAGIGFVDAPAARLRPGADPLAQPWPLVHAARAEAQSEALRAQFQAQHAWLTAALPAGGGRAAGATHVAAAAAAAVAARVSARQQGSDVEVRLAEPRRRKRGSWLARREPKCGEQYHSTAMTAAETRPIRRVIHEQHEGPEPDGQQLQLGGPDGPVLEDESLLLNDALDGSVVHLSSQDAVEGAERRAAQRRREQKQPRSRCIRSARAW